MPARPTKPANAVAWGARPDLDDEVAPPAAAAVVVEGVEALVDASEAAEEAADEAAAEICEAVPAIFGNGQCHCY